MSTNAFVKYEFKLFNIKLIINELKYYFKLTLNSKKSVYTLNGATVVTRACSTVGTCNTQRCTGSNSVSSATYYCITDTCNSGILTAHIKMSTLVMTTLSTLVSYKIFF